MVAWLPHDKMLSSRGLSAGSYTVTKAGSRGQAAGRQHFVMREPWYGVKLLDYTHKIVI